MIELQNVRNIAVFIFADVEELDFVGVYEVLCKSRGMKEEGVLTFDNPCILTSLPGNHRFSAETD